MRDPVELSAWLEQHAHEVDFYQLCRLLENAYSNLPRIGESLRPRDDAVRFAQLPELMFHATAVGNYVPAGAEPARLNVNFFGLTGPNAPMPIHFTEYTRDRLRNGDDATLSRFLDIFHHRFLQLFYRSRAMAEPVISLDRNDNDRFSNYLGALFGIGSPALRERDAVSDFAKLHFTGLMAGKTRPASGLVTILRDYFHLPIKLQQFVGHWMYLPREVRSRLGDAEGAQLGVSAVLGERVWDCQNKFRLIIGPLDYAEYRRMLPGGESIKRLIAWIRNYCGDALEWDVQLILKKEETPPLALGSDVRLGFSTWLCSRPLPHDGDELTYSPTARLS
ncbi:type VI secretion system baseplate subunit TssG [Massilia sp. W12]|uniref:type VI secretion system baseplate subunit TssG n=1 Tax=Massilia sp. W12 TaxID=3126507 RepID=UPI0030CB7825